MNSCIKLVTIIFCINIFTACGSDSNGGPSSSKPEEKAPYSMALKNKKSLPDCSDKNQNQLVYVTDEKEFYNCNGETWELIDIVSDEMSNNTGTIGTTGAFWDDQKTGITWFIDDSQIYSNSSNHTCEPKHFIQPSANEIKTALKNGLLSDLHVRVSVEQNIYVFSDAPTTEYDGQTDVTLRTGAFRVCKVQK